MRQAAHGEDLSHGGGHSTQALVYAEEGRWSVVIEGLRLPGPQSRACHFSRSVTSDKWLKHSLPLFLIFEVVVKPHRVVARGLY